MIVDNNNKIIVLRSVVCKNKLWKMVRSTNWKILHISPLVPNQDAEMIYRMIAGRET